MKRISKTEKNVPGCDEYFHLSRRNFLRLSGGTLLAAAAPTWLPRVVLADSEQSDRDVLVHIFLPGGCDGLSLCVPHGENNYYNLRPNLAFPRPDSGAPNAVLDLDGFFGLPPSMAPLLESYQQGDLLIVHACGSKDPTRSHFDAINYMQIGVPQPPSSLFTGWLGRHLLTSAPTLSDGAVRAVGIGFGLQRLLAGGPKALPVSDLEGYGFVGYEPFVQEEREILRQMYEATREPLQRSAANTQRTVDLLDSIDFENYQAIDGIAYPEGDLGRALRSSAALIKAEVGVEVVAIDYGGWDTHDDQGPFDGAMHFLMSELATGLAAFYADLRGGGIDRLTVVAMSEFGRNVEENGSRGTDHGHGNVMLAMGDGIAGGKILTQWPGLENEQLYEGQDLEVTIDYRDVMAEIVTRRLANNRVDDIFPDPDFVPREWGVTLPAAQSVGRRLT